jgi:hypothetical protein
MISDSDSFGGLQHSGEKIIYRFAEADRLEVGGLSPIEGKLTC